MKQKKKALGLGMYQWPTQTWCGLMRVYKGVESSTKTKVETPICRIINCDKNKQKKNRTLRKEITGSIVYS